MLGSLLGGMLGFASTAYSNSQNYGYQKKLQEHQLALQDEYQRKYAADAPSIQKQALQNAGINPLLAGNMSPAGESLSFGAGFSGGDYASGVANGMNSMSSAKQAKMAERQVDVAEQNADTAKQAMLADNYKKFAEASTAQAQKELIDEQKKWLPQMNLSTIGLNSASANYQAGQLLQLMEAGKFDREHPYWKMAKEFVPNVNLNFGSQNSKSRVGRLS